MHHPSLLGESSSARVVSNMIELYELRETTAEGRRFFRSAIQREISILKSNLDSNEKKNNEEALLSTPYHRRHHPPDHPPDSIVIDTRIIFRLRLLENISALVELAEMNRASPMGKRIFWESLKLELKALNDLDKDGLQVIVEEKEETVQNRDGSGDKEDPLTKSLNGVLKDNPGYCRTGVDSFVKEKDCGREESSDIACTKDHLSAVVLEGGNKNSHEIIKHETAIAEAIDTTCICTASIASAPTIFGKEFHSSDDTSATKSSLHSQSFRSLPGALCGVQQASPKKSKAWWLRGRNRNRSRSNVRIFPPPASPPKHWLSPETPKNDQKDHGVMEMVFYTAENGIKY